MRPDISIIYEDNHLLVACKPANMPTQSDRSGDPDLHSLLKKYIKEKYHKPGNVFLGIVHRLDRPTSGLIVFAKTSKAAGRLADQMRGKKMQKEYLAVVHGYVSDNGLLEHHLAKNREKNIVSIVSENDKKAKKAALTFNTLECKHNLSLVNIHLITGRSHQIRVQFANVGNPVWGDYKYGIASQSMEGNLALHAHLLRFTHPTREKILTFINYPPILPPWDAFSRLREMINESSAPSE